MIYTALITIAVDIGTRSPQASSVVSIAYRENYLKTEQIMWLQLAHVGVSDAGQGLGGLLLGIIVPAAFGLLFLYIAFTGTTERFTL